VCAALVGARAVERALVGRELGVVERERWLPTGAWISSLSTAG
jgi:hypothetical protein